MEEAKAKAVESFGVSEDKITFRTIEEIKKGLFRKPSVKIEAEYEEEVSSSSGEAVVPPVKAVKEEKKVVAEESTAVTAPVKTETAEVEVTAPVAEETTDAADEPAEAAPEIPSDEKTDTAVNYIVSVLEAMGLENISAVPSAADGGIVIEINADGLGELIGKKGELLDALQYLSSLVCNKIDREYFRITTDSCGFRERRKAQLERLAHKLANNVRKSGRTHSLEPMNPYERRIIHAAVSEVEGVTSKSVGEEPYRKVVISSTEKRPGGYRGKGGRRGGRGHSAPRKPHYDITTSFEKNYKKPKPEDDMDLGSGVYGKIEF